MEFRFALVLATLSLASGCSNGSADVVLPSFGDVTDAPGAIQTAALAVVRIGTAGELATGSFISDSGLLLTNNHVLGVDICPAEGCYAQIAFQYQKGLAWQAPQTFFVVPRAIDVGLDMAVVQVLSAPGGAAIATPHYLTLESRDPASLRGTHVHVVGHPEGHLKKWTQGQVVDSNGSWIWFSAYSLPGNSGSPILDDAGHVVGILHRGPTSQDLVTGGGVDEFSIGTASSALLGSIAAPPDNGALRSVIAAATADDVVQHHQVYLNAHVANALVDAALTPVLGLLGTACDAALAQTTYDSPDTMSLAFAPCTAAPLWIECRSEFLSTSSGTVCPADGSAWIARYQSVFDRWVQLNGEVTPYDVSFAVAELSGSRDAGTAAGGQALQQALGAQHAPLDFGLAVYLSAFDVLTYGGASVVDFVKGYGGAPDYGLYGADIADAALWLLDNSAMSRSDALGMLKTLAGDGNVDIEGKLFIEDMLYQSGEL